MVNESREVAVEQENIEFFGVSGVGRTAKLTEASLSTRNMAVRVETHCSLLLPKGYISSHSNTITALIDLTTSLYRSATDYQTRFLES